jgi:hypothetical protein
MDTSMEHTTHVSEGYYGTEFTGTIVTEPQAFIQEERAKKLLREEKFPVVLSFMDKKQKEIQKLLDYHNNKENDKMTFDKLKRIANGWSLDDVEALIGYTKRGKVVELTRELLDW